MKKTLVLGVLLAGTIGAFAQGTIQFNNIVTASGLRAPIYGPELGNPTLSQSGNPATGLPVGTTVYTGALLSGTGFTAQLWGASGANLAVGSLQILATTTFRTGTAVGFVNTATLPGATSLTPVPNAPIDGTPYRGTFQLRAWDNIGGTITSWAMVLANDSIPRGTSAVLSPLGPLGGTAAPPATAPILEGLVSFNLHTVPEPSLIALGALGLGALLLRRRK